MNLTIMEVQRIVETYQQEREREARQERILSEAEARNSRNVRK